MSRALATSLMFVAAVNSIAAGNKTKDYENFDLPRKHSSPVTSNLAFENSRVTVRGKNVRMKTSSVDAREYIFAKEAFLSEKRDQAIKLLRQELDAGMTANRDNMLLRLGQLYAEKYMELSYRETELYSAELQDFEKKKALDKNYKGAVPRIDSTRSKSYLGESLGLFYKLEKDFPKHPKMDEVLFFIGFVEMESDKPNGVRYLERVIRQYPRSRKFEEAVVYLADYYFEKTKFRDALAKYSILLHRGDSPLFPYARYKIAWCDLNLNQPRKGLAGMQAVVEMLAGATEKSKFNLREQALKDLVLFFAEVEAVEEASSYFADKVGRDKMLENLRLIADILRSKARDIPAAKAYTRLLEEYPDSLEAPNFAMGLYDSMNRLGRTEQAVKTMETACERYGEKSSWADKYRDSKPAEMKAAQNNLQTEAEKAALFLHQSAQKSKNKGQYVYALRLYNAILSGFPNHPSRKNIAFYRGEVYYEQNKFIDAASSYMDAAKVPPKDKRTDEAVYSALEALDQMTARQGKIERLTPEKMKTVSLEPEEIPEGEKRFIEVANYYITEYPQGDRVVDVRFRVAAIYYRRHHYDMAQAQLKELALKHPKHRTAQTAAHLVLDIYNVKKDYESLGKTAVEFSQVQGLGDSKFKEELKQIVAEVGFKSIEKVEASSKWAEAGDQYLAVYRANPNGSLAEKSLYNAVVSYEKGGETVKASQASQMFVAKYPKSQYTEKLMLSQARLAEQQYDFELAQKLFSDFRKRFPKNAESKKALYNAAVFAELLEKNETANGLYNEVLADRAVPEAERRAIQESQAKIFRRMGQFDKMAASLRRLARDARGTEEKMRYTAELARQYDIAGKVTEKNGVLRELKYQYESAKDAKLSGYTAYYVAEAIFQASAPKREKYAEIKLRFPPEDLIYLMKRKEKLLTQLVESYEKVIALGVPEWGVAALYERANAFGDYAQSFRGIAIPAKYQGELKADTEKSLQAIYTTRIKPVEEKKTENLKLCMERGQQFHVANEFARKCFDMVKKGEPELSGRFPTPSYWSTRPPNAEVANR